MIEAKGGIGELHDNWRLELVVYLWVTETLSLVLIFLTSAVCLSCPSRPGSSLQTISPKSPNRLPTPSHSTQPWTSKRYAVFG